MARPEMWVSELMGPLIPWGPEISPPVYVSSSHIRSALRPKRWSVGFNFLGLPTEKLLKYRSLRNQVACSDGKEPAYNAGTSGLIPESGRSSGERNGYPLQYSCLENSMDRRAWWVIARGAAKSRT